MREANVRYFCFCPGGDLAWECMVLLSLVSTECQYVRGKQTLSDWSQSQSELGTRDSPSQNDGDFCIVAQRFRVSCTNRIEYCSDCPRALRKFGWLLLAGGSVMRQKPMLIPKIMACILAREEYDFTHLVYYLRFADAIIQPQCAWISNAQSLSSR